MTTDKALIKAAWKVRDEIAAITSTEFNEYAPQVIQAFKVKPPKGYTRGDIFWALDTSPIRFDFTYSPDWHAKLRNVRNTPETGRALFDTFTI
jgi:hypothetical protein